VARVVDYIHEPSLAGQNDHHVHTMSKSISDLDSNRSGVRFMLIMPHSSQRSQNHPYSRAGCVAMDSAVLRSSHIAEQFIQFARTR